MAKVSAHGTELFRYFSTRYSGLLSVRSDGVTLRKTPLSGGWKLLFRKHASVSMESWIANKRQQMEREPAWAQACKSIPSLDRLRAWERDGTCETPTGVQVEPDGSDAGVPSWLRAFNMI